ncbi:MAG TPA: hypothetical protein VFE32_17275 [Puia sp.]|jgi:hypothetical protein|nr:hypothetical protein [Puia sp.]
MDAVYVLKQVYRTAKKCREAQKAYYACREPKESKMKQAHYAEAKRREADLDRLIAQLPALVPELKTADTEA